MDSRKRTRSNVITMPKPVENRAAVVDRYGVVKAQVIQFKPVADEYERLGKTIRGWYENAPADKSFTESGSSFRVDISARSNERLAHKVKLYARLGKKKFIDLCSFTLKALESALPGEEIPAYVTESQTGSRRLDVVPIEVKEAA